MKILTLTKLDLKLQMRSGIPFLYLGVTILYVTLLYFLPANWEEKIFPIILATDPSVMGFLFVGAILSFEKDQGTLAPLGVSPLTLDYYITAKVLSLGGTAILSALIVAVIIKGTLIAIIWVFLAVGLTAPFFILLGISISLKFRNLSSYFILSGVVDIPALAPFILSILGLNSPWLLLLPTQGTYLMLTMASGKEVPLWQIPIAIASLILWTILAWIGANLSLKKAMTEMAGGIE